MPAYRIPTESTNSVGASDSALGDVVCLLQKRPLRDCRGLFAAIERGLQKNVHIGRVEDPIVCLASDDYNGLLRCRAVFWVDSYLVVLYVVAISSLIASRIAGLSSRLYGA